MVPTHFIYIFPLDGWRYYTGMCRKDRVKARDREHDRKYGERKKGPLVPIMETSTPRKSEIQVKKWPSNKKKDAYEGASKERKGE